MRRNPMAFFAGFDRTRSQTMPSRPGISISHFWTSWRRRFPIKIPGDFRIWWVAWGGQAVKR